MPSENIKKVLTMLEEPAFQNLRNLQIAKKALRNLLYFDEKIADIIKEFEQSNHQSKQKTTFYTPQPDALPFNLYESTSKEVKENLQRLVSTIEAGFAIFLKNQEAPALVKTFIMNIRDTESGCLEARYGEALKFISTVEENNLPVMELNQLMSLFQNEFLQQNIDQNNQKIIFKKAFDFFSPYIQLQKSVTVNGTVEIINWEMIKSYMAETLCYEEIHQCWPDLLAELEPPTLIQENIQNTRSYLFNFSCEKDAENYLNFIKSIIKDPILLQEIAGKARVIIGQNSLYRFRLTAKQYAAFISATTARDLFDKEDSAWLLKVVRFDTGHCFLPQFLNTITDSNKKHPLRPGNHKKYKLDQHENKIIRQGTQPKRIKKRENLQFQSASLLTPQMHALAFGSRKRNTVAFMFPAKDTSIKFRFLYDSATFYRPWEGDTIEDVRKYYKKTTQENNQTLFFEEEDFKKKITEDSNQTHYNEVLAGLTWNDQCFIAILNDDLESRLLAQEAASALKNQLRQEATKSGKNFDENCQPCIRYYIHDSLKHFKLYSLKQQESDRKTAREIFANKEQRNNKDKCEKYEFLLSLTEEMLNNFYHLLYHSTTFKEYRVIISTIYECTGHEPLLIKIARDYPHIAANIIAKDTKKIYKSISSSYPFVNASLDAFNENGNSALHEAVKYGDLNLVICLLELGADVNQENWKNLESYERKTPLHLAAYYGWDEIVSVLLEKGARVNSSESVSFATPLHLAAQFGHTDTIEILLKNKADINKTALYWQTPLELAIINNHKKTALKLINKQADTHYGQNQNIKTLLKTAENNVYLSCDLIKHLINNNQTMSQEELYLSLYYAALTNDKTFVTLVLLIQQTVANPNQNQNIKTLLKKAKGNARLYCVLTQHLINNNQTVPQEELNLSLYYAALTNDKTFVTLLLEKGAEINPPAGKNVKLPLVGATKGNNLDMVNFLLSKSANPLAKDSAGKIAADYACNPNIKEILLKAALTQYKQNREEDPNEYQSIFLRVLAKTPLGNTEFLKNHSKTEKLKGVSRLLSNEQSQIGAFNNGQLSTLNRIYKI